MVLSRSFVSFRSDALVCPIQAKQFHVKDQVLDFMHDAGNIKVSSRNAHLEFYYRYLPKN